MRYLKAAEHKRMPWKNGGGETIEIAVHPPGADLGSFAWRLSMATVASDGPFSVFPGIDRTLAILEGVGLDLDIAGLGRHGLTATSEPLSFPADVPTAGMLHAGAITDLNVMTRRGAYRHRVRRMLFPDGGTLVAEARWTFVLPLAACRVEAAGEGIAAVAGDAIAAEKPGEVLRLSAEAPTSAYVVEIED